MTYFNWLRRKASKMEIDYRVENGILIIVISSRLDAASAPIAEGEINKALEYLSDSIKIRPLWE